jgi:Fe2+ transport system protein FeoA
MAKQERKRQKQKLNLDTFRDGIKGKVLEAVSITNELESRYISLGFQDQTELTITLDVRLTGKLELFDCKTGDQRLVRKIGLVPDDTPLWRPKG